MRIGIDSYSYHRLLGEIRPGERDPGERLVDTPALVTELVAAGAEVVSLETVFLAPPDRLDTDALRAAAGSAEIAVAWGHPLGLEWGSRPERLTELLAWIELAPALEAKLVRCVLAGPALADAPKPRRFADSVRALTTAVHAAQRAGVTLALENHADVDIAELRAILDAVPGLMVCYDTANALRVGEDPVAFARAVASRAAMVHLKDVARPSPADGLTGPPSVAYGDGVVDLAGVLAALGDAPARPVCVELGHLGGEVDERALVRAGVAWLRARANPDRGGGVRRAGR